jgi:hypothetical protein
MNYNEWIEALDTITKTRRNNILLEKLEKEEVNENFQKQLSDRIDSVIREKLKTCIKRVKKEINMMFNDENSLELIINNFKKDIEYIKRLNQLKALDPEMRDYINNQIYILCDEIFDLLANESVKIDGTGMYKQIINKKRIKRDDIT